MVTGSYTIPLMKKYGYEPEFAASVEAISSTGGGVTPPIMSITAFMMAEFLNISYLKIIGYALIPCVLYYTGVFAGAKTISVVITSDKNSSTIPLPPPSSRVLPGRRAFLICPYHFE